MFVRLAVAPDFPRAALLQGKLGAEGVRTLDVQMSAHASLAGADTGYFIEVHREDVERATKLLFRWQEQKLLL